MDTPTMKRKNGMTKSAKVMSSHGLWSTWPPSAPPGYAKVGGDEKGGCCVPMRLAARSHRTIGCAVKVNLSVCGWAATPPLLLLSPASSTKIITATVKPRMASRDTRRSRAGFGAGGACRGGRVDCVSCVCLRQASDGGEEERQHCNSPRAPCGGSCACGELQPVWTLEIEAVQLRGGPSGRTGRLRPDGSRFMQLHCSVGELRALVLGVSAGPAASHSRPRR